VFTSGLISTDCPKACEVPCIVSTHSFVDEKLVSIKLKKHFIHFQIVSVHQSSSENQQEKSRLFSVLFILQITLPSESIIEIPGIYEGGMICQFSFVVGIQEPDP
jgi:hypothetical protein